MQALFAGRPHKIYRQYTLCKSKPGDLQQTQALPFMLDLTLALATDMQPPSIVQSSLDEMVFQATLQASSKYISHQHAGSRSCHWHFQIADMLLQATSLRTVSSPVHIAY